MKLDQNWPPWSQNDVEVAVPRDAKNTAVHLAIGQPRYIEGLTSPCLTPPRGYIMCATGGRGRGPLLVTHP